MLRQHPCKCPVSTEAADDLMLNKAACSVITQMQFVSHDCCCSKFRCRERDEGREKRRESSSVFPVISGGDARWVFFSSSLARSFRCEDFLASLHQGEAGVSCSRDLSLQFCQYLHSHCYCTSVSKATFSCRVGAAWPEGQSSAGDARNPRYFLSGRAQQRHSKV